jgi:hypothetical protein
MVVVVAAPIPGGPQAPEVVLLNEDGTCPRMGLANTARTPVRLCHMAGMLALSVMGHRVYRPDDTSMLRPARVRPVIS